MKLLISVSFAVDYSVIITPQVELVS